MDTQHAPAAAGEMHSSAQPVLRAACWLLPRIHCWYGTVCRLASSDEFNTTVAPVLSATLGQMLDDFFQYATELQHSLEQQGEQIVALICIAYYRCPQNVLWHAACVTDCNLRRVCCVHGVSRSTHSVPLVMMHAVLPWVCFISC
jgi:hypothetical protein